MLTGPVEAGATIVTNVALAAAQAAVTQQAQFNDTIERSAERKVEEPASRDDDSGNAEEQSGFAGFDDGTSPQSSDPARGNQVDIEI